MADSNFYYLQTIFAIPESQNVVADGLGLLVFLGVLFGFFFGTILFAMLLGPAVHTYEKAAKTIKKDRQIAAARKVKPVKGADKILL